jgi:hypothetical protein
MTDEEELRRRLEETRAELQRLQLTLAVVGTTDLDAGIRNRNGVLEALERGRKWMSRRGDIYGLLVAQFPRAAPGAAEPEVVRHVAATIAAGVREVDEVGRVDATTHAAVLNDLAAGSVHVVADRVAGLLEALAAATPELGGTFRIGAVEVLNAAHTSGAVLDTALRLAEGALPGTAVVGQI